ncbi:hypothetical protein SDC9_111057 [bioreactor metagenome]|uniref:Uncharacterized protein n=1 Tax=bioreactor metagenome TaxID=1076179 RepID=A0A645BHX9_9ZZZZ
MLLLKDNFLFVIPAYAKAPPAITAPLHTATEPVIPNNKVKEPIVAAA